MEQVFNVGEQYGGKSLSQISEELYKANRPALGNTSVLAEMLGMQGQHENPLKAGQQLTLRGDVSPTSAEAIGLREAFGSGISKQEAAVAPAIKTLSEGQKSLADRYKGLIDSIKGREQQAVQRSDINTATEFGKRGILPSSGIVADTQANRARDIGVSFAGEEANVGLQAEQQQQAVPQQPQQNVGLGGMKQPSQADIERMIAEQAPMALQKHVQKLQQDQMVNTFVSKMQAAEQQYPGLEEELNNLNYNDPRMHAFIAMANQMENTVDIMKEVLDNPSKMESLLNMAHNQPYQAQKALKGLSDSIKTNQTAKAEEAQARDPMSQIKSSTTSGNMEKSQHDMSQEDLRRLLVKKFK